MTTFDAATAECLVYVFAEGMLGRAFGHDLALRVTRFTIAVDDETGAIDADFDARSLRVMTARSKDGRDEPGTLSEKDKRTIEAHILNDVLKAERYPSVRFRASGASDGRVTGQLTLHGVTREISAQLEERSGQRSASLRIHQPDFGIAPFKALLGAMRVKPDVRVEVRVSP